jgi:hypothetical protein
MPCPYGWRDPGLHSLIEETMRNWGKGSLTKGNRRWAGDSPSGREDPDVIVLMDEEPG